MSARQIRVGSLMLAVLTTALVSCSGRGERAAPEAPDEAVRVVVRGLADGEPVVAWDALPASYQDELTGLVREAAGKMDAELWNRSFGIVRKVHRLLEEKQEFILDHPMVASQIKDRKKAEKGWDAMVELLDAVIDSELADLNELRTIDIRRFLDRTGSRIMDRLAEAAELSDDHSYADGMAKLRETEVRVLEVSGDRAKLRVGRPGKDPVDETFVRVEGKWIPQKLAQAWPASMADARRRLSEYSGEELRRKKPALLMQISMVEEALDGLIEAKTNEQFNAEIMGLVGMAMSAAMTARQQGNGGGIPFGMPFGGGEGTAVPDSTASPPRSESDAALRGSSGGRQSSFPGAGTLEARSSGGRMSTAKSPEGFVAGSIPVRDADRYVGAAIAVVAKDGQRMHGRLAAVRRDRLVFDQYVSGGTLSFELRKSEIRHLILL